VEIRIPAREARVRLGQVIALTERRGFLAQMDPPRAEASVPQVAQNGADRAIERRRVAGRRIRDLQSAELAVNEIPDAGDAWT
jgi:hypothetical protein